MCYARQHTGFHGWLTAQKSVHRAFMLQRFQVGTPSACPLHYHAVAAALGMPMATARATYIGIHPCKTRHALRQTLVAPALTAGTRHTNVAVFLLLDTPARSHGGGGGMPTPGAGGPRVCTPLPSTKRRSELSLSPQAVNRNSSRKGVLVVLYMSTRDPKCWENIKRTRILRKLPLPPRLHVLQERIQLPRVTRLWRIFRGRRPATGRLRLLPMPRHLSKSVRQNAAQGNGERSLSLRLLALPCVGVEFVVRTIARPG